MFVWFFLLPQKGRAGLHLAAELGHEGKSPSFEFGQLNGTLIIVCALKLIYFVHSPDVCDILLEHNAFVNVRNKIGMTPLHYAGQ